jgi:hypothetical protein
MGSVFSAASNRRQHKNVKKAFFGVDGFVVWV